MARSVPPVDSEKEFTYETKKTIQNYNGLDSNLGASYFDFAVGDIWRAARSPAPVDQC